MSTSKSIPLPSKELLKHYLAKWEELDDYKDQEKALNLLFKDLCSENDTLEKILLKTVALNDFYSTQIFAIHQVAKHISTIKNLDKRIEEGDYTLIMEIANVTIIGKDGEEHDKCFYSFATKYCSHHNQNAFAIYDSYISKVLRHLRKVKQISNFQNEDLKDYAKYSALLQEMNAKFSLGASTKELDKFLWLYGKEYFPNKYYG